MKKRFVAGVAMLVAVVAGVVGVSAFESHIINVTAKIENALSIIPESITFGTVFPQEIRHQNLKIALSNSFLNETRVNSVNYRIVQKLHPIGSGSASTTENISDVTGATGTYYPALCSYLSEHKIEVDNGQTENQVNSFHKGRFWASSGHVMYNAIATGRLDKSVSDTVDDWDIDLAAPCFEGQCAQDWTSWVASVNSSANASEYKLPTSLKDATLMCDLWIEVTGIDGSSTPVVTPVCGNNVKETGEECDGTDKPANRTCASNCTLVPVNNPVCGNGIKEGSEQCDGASGVGAHQTCSSTCQLSNLTYCGDNIKQTPNQEGVNEQCDGTDKPANRTCTSSCTLVPVTNPVCGNNVKEGSEECDGTDKPAGRTCNANCTLVPVSNPVCGNGIKEGSEQCDYLSGVGLHQRCDLTCHLVNLTYCGDNIKQTPNQESVSEECDGTDKPAGRVCNANCTLAPLAQVCGNGVKEGTEKCDINDGVGAHQRCNSSCQLVGVTYCGDGIKQTPNQEGKGGLNDSGNEQCDGADVAAGKTCQANCTFTDNCVDYWNQIFNCMRAIDGRTLKCGELSAKVLQCIQGAEHITCSTAAESNNMQNLLQNMYNSSGCSSVFSSALSDGYDQNAVCQTYTQSQQNGSSSSTSTTTTCSSYVAKIYYLSNYPYAN